MRYFALLRGINVSGQKKIKMADLRDLFETMGFTEVITYIQSGNIIFNSAPQVNFVGLIEQTIENHYGFHVPVIIRTKEEIHSIIDNCPPVPAGEESRFLVSLLSKSLPKNTLEILANYTSSEERVWMGKTEIYFHCPGGSGKSKLTNNLMEKKLSCSATTRNWKTILKIYQLSL